MSFINNIHIEILKKLLFLVLLLSLCSCLDDVNILTNVFWEDSSTVKASTNSTNLIIIGQPNVKWSAEIIEGADWCSFSETNANLLSAKGFLVDMENKVTLYFKNNSTTHSRQAKISLTLAGKDNAVFTLTQNSGFSIFTETPSVVENDNYQYVTHYSQLHNKSVRNFSICFDKTKQASLWVAYPIHSSYLGSTGRTDAWAFDPEVNSKFQADCVFRSYNGNYDRGHQIASADRQANREMNEQTFYMSNMTPQWNRLNQDMWANLEMRVRANNCSDTLFVVTGAYFDPNNSTTTRDGAGNQVSVPTHYYKVLLRTKSGTTGKAISQCSDDELISIGFWVEHRSYGNIEPPRSICKSITDIEAITGFTFFPMVSEKVKTQNEPAKWGVY